MFFVSEVIYTNQYSQSKKHRSHFRSTLRKESSVRVVKQLISALEGFPTETMKAFSKSVSSAQDDKYKWTKTNETSLKEFKDANKIPN